MAFQGSCLCGKVRYRISGALISADHCHCSLCRKQHGAAFATYANFASQEFTWLQGGVLIKIFERRSGAGWCFCTECGSTLAGTEKGEITSVTLGSIEGDPGVRPECHIHVGSKSVWYDISDDLPQHDSHNNHD